MAGQKGQERIQFQNEQKTLLFWDEDRDRSISRLCGAKAPHPTSLFFYIINTVIVILVPECVTSSPNSLSMY